MATAEKKKVVPLMVDEQDIDTLRKAIVYILDTQIKTGQHDNRVRLYRLNRRLYQAQQRLDGRMPRPRRKVTQ